MLSTLSPVCTCPALTAPAALLVQILTQSKITRRSLFILTMALGWGFAVELVPHFVDLNLWPATPDMSEAVKGLNDSVQVTATAAGIGIALHAEEQHIPARKWLCHSCTSRMVRPLWLH